MKRIKRISFITLTYVFGFIVWALFSAFIEWIFNMIKNPDVECTQTKSHQQIIDKLDLLIKDK